MNAQSDNDNFYRTKPRTVKAFQLTFERIQDNADWPSWLHEAWNKERGENGSLYLHYNTPRALAIYTAEGPQMITPNDWIIDDGIGPLYPCKPHVFAEKYEKVSG